MLIRNLAKFALETEWAASGFLATANGMPVIANTVIQKEVGIGILKC